jgi:hypothetical protein
MLCCGRDYERRHNCTSSVSVTWFQFYHEFCLLHSVSAWLRYFCPSAHSIYFRSAERFWYAPSSSLSPLTTRALTVNIGVFGNCRQQCCLYSNYTSGYECPWILKPRGYVKPFTRVLACREDPPICIFRAPWKWREQALPKRRYLPTNVHGFISVKQ